VTPPAVVVGAGALGSLLSALWSRRATVTLVARPASAAALRRAGGIRIEGLCAGFYPVAVATEPTPAPGAVVVVAVKAYDLEAALLALAPRLDPSHTVVVLQNGLGVRAAAERVLGRPVTRGVTFLAAARDAPGVVRYNASGKTYLPSGSVALELWRGADLPVEPVDAIERYEWRKLAINAVINPLSALLGVDNGALLPLANGVRSLVAELAAVAQRDGCELDADETLDKILASMRQTARNPSSMLQDVRAGRRTEIDWINGAVVRLGERYGVATPQHRLLVELVRFKAAQAANGTRCDD
jgi:2-dehydropantoate 2-reductase